MDQLQTQALEQVLAGSQLGSAAPVPGELTAGGSGV